MSFPQNLVIPEPNSGCHIWLGWLNYSGYGYFRGKRAHRIAWVRAHGAIPEGMCVLHRCDNRSCVNPDHLFIGTQTDNIADMERKNRQFRKGRAKLSDDDVRAILADERAYKDIAKQYQIDASAITRIKQGERYTHVQCVVPRETRDARSIRWHR